MGRFEITPVQSAGEGDFFKKLKKKKQRGENEEDREKKLWLEKSEIYSDNVGWPNRNYKFEEQTHVMV